MISSFRLATFILAASLTSAFGAQLTLEWTDNSVNETQFKIERRLTSGTDADFAQVTTVAKNTTTYTDTGLTTGTDYTYRIRASNSTGDSAYTANAHAVALNPQTVTFPALAGVTYGDPAFSITNVTASSSLTSFTFSSSNTAVATVSGNTITIVGAGTTTITATQPGDTNWGPASATQTLTVAKSPQTITFNALTAVKYLDPSFTLTATSSSGLPISYSSSTTSVASLSGSTVTIGTVGTTTITASQGGDPNFLPATSVQQTLTVGKADQTITFGALPTKTLGVDGPFTLTGTSTSSLTISYGNSNPSVASVSGSTVTPLKGGTITITANQSGSSLYNAATPVSQMLTINAAATFSSQPQNRTINIPASGTPQNTSMSVSTTGANPAATLQWQQSTDGGTSWSDISGATGTSLAITSPPAANNTKYRCIATNTVASVASSVATLTVNQAPVFTTQPTSQSAAAGDNATITVAVTGSPTPTLQWQVSTASPYSTYTNLSNDSTYSGVTGTSLTITGVTGAMNNYHYRCAATNVANTTNSNPATLTVGNAAPAITSDPSDTSTPAGGNASFSVSATGGPTPTYSWEVSTDSGASWNPVTNGGVYSGATTSTLTITGATITLSGYKYRAKATNSVSSATSAAATLTVTTTAPSFTTQPNNQAVADGGSTSFTVAAAGNPTPTLQWQISTDGGTSWTNLTNTAPYSGVTTSTLSISDVTGLNGMRFHCVATNGTLPDATSNAALLTVATTVAPAFTTQPSNASISIGGNASFHVVMTGTPTPTVKWQISTDGGTSWSDVPNAAPYSNVTTTTLTITNATTALNAMKYRAEATNSAGTTDSDAATLSVLAVPVTFTTQPTSLNITPGSNATFTAAATGNPTPTLQWQVSTDTGATWNDLANTAPYSGVTTGTLTITSATLAMNGYQYHCVGSNVAGPVASNAATLTVTNEQPVAPQISAQPVSKTVTAGDAFSFTVIATGTPAPTYQWQHNGASILGQTTATLSIQNAQAMDAGDYNVVVTNSAGSVTSSTATLTVYTPPGITTQPANLTAVLGGSASFTVVASGNPAVTYQWRKDGNIIAGATSATYSLSHVSPRDAGGYDVVVSNTVGTVTSRSATLTINLSSYIGEYFGTLSGGGTWALYVRADNTGTYIAYLPDRHSAIVIDVVIDNTGAFSATGSEVRISNAGAATADAGSRHAATAALAAAAISGTISSGGQVTGQISSIGQTLTGTADSGANTSAGFYKVSALGASGAMTYAIVGGSGQTLVVTTTSTSVDGASGTLSGSGQLDTTTTTGAQLKVTIDSSKLSLNATYTPVSSGTVTFTGVADSVAVTTRLVNLSARANASSGDNTLIIGVVVSGGSKQLLVRGDGPSLTTVGIPSGYMADPTINIAADKTVIASNDNWGTGDTTLITNTGTNVGAFPLITGSKDAALVATLNGGAYTALVSGANGSSGVALAEFYDAAQNTAARLVNFSARSQVGTGQDALVCGLVVNGNAPKQYLFRGVGPGLTPFGVTTPLADPVLTVQPQNSSTIVAQNDNWGGSTTLSSRFTSVGAFGLDPASKDAAMIVTLAPGVYTVTLSGVNNTTGVGLIEIYELP